MGRKLCLEVKDTNRILSIVGTINDGRRHVTQLHRIDGKRNNRVELFDRYFRSPGGICEKAPSLLRPNVVGELFRRRVELRLSGLDLFFETVEELLGTLKIL